MFPAALPEWRRLFDAYPSMSATEVYKALREVLQKPGNQVTAFGSRSDVITGHERKLTNLSQKKILP